MLLGGSPPQITAEQILREAKELQEQDFKAPKQKISDEAELAEYRLRKRKEFEDLVRRVRWNSSVWVKVGPSPPCRPHSMQASPRPAFVGMCCALRMQRRAAVLCGACSLHALHSTACGGGPAHEPRCGAHPWQLSTITCCL